jgi:2-polyprenyl-3-methyl-5-hydroxy-6-metoxy-1,4-benzoquinol methylase
MTNLTNEENIRHYSKMPIELLSGFGEEGDFARQYLLNPAIFRLLGPVKGKTILDAGCGQGYLARLLARKGADVIGMEPTPTLINHAIEREREEKLGIQYIQADLSYYSQPALQFEAVVSNMVLMDIPEYEKALSNCLGWLVPGGSLVFSLSHPCFEASYAEYMSKGYLEVKEYFAEYLIAQTYGYRLHRPLSHYLNAVVRHQGIIKEVVEPQLEMAHLPQPLDEAERDLHVPSFIIIHATKAV